MLLYHGTSSKHLSRILRDGLTPRGRRRTNWAKVPSRPDMVYLTTAYPFYFAMNVTTKTHQPVVIEIDSEMLDKDLFYPDEDFIYQALLHAKPEDHKEHTYVRVFLRLYQEHWRTSLQHLGNCCYQGPIPVSAIRRYCRFDPNARPELAWRMMDPTISLLNFEICGADYTGLVAWMFGDVDELPQDSLGGELAKVDPQYEEKEQFRRQQSRDRKGIEVREVSNGARSLIKAEST